MKTAFVLQCTQSKYNELNQVDPLINQIFEKELSKSLKKRVIWKANHVTWENYQSVFIIK